MIKFMLFLSEGLSEGGIIRQVEWPILPRIGEEINFAGSCTVKVSDIEYYLDDDHKDVPMIEVQCNNVRIQDLRMLYEQGGWELEDIAEAKLFRDDGLGLPPHHSQRD